MMMKTSGELNNTPYTEISEKNCMNRPIESAKIIEDDDKGKNI